MTRLQKVLPTQFELKNDGKGQFSGRASVYGVIDGYGDIVMPGAFTKTLRENGGRIKVLAQHDHADVIGIGILTDRKDALYIEGQLELGLPSARDTYTRIKGGLIDGISIGYSVAAGGESFDRNGHRLLTEIDLWEVSLVTWPANSAARVTDVKRQSSDTAALHQFAAAMSAWLLRTTVDEEIHKQLEPFRESCRKATRGRSRGPGYTTENVKAVFDLLKGKK